MESFDPAAAQDPPVHGRADITSYVVRDLEDRRKAGIKKYGQPLMTDDGRNGLIDAYQEAVDLTVYLRKRLEEDLASIDDLREIRRLVDDSRLAGVMPPAVVLSHVDRVLARFGVKPRDTKSA